MLPPHNVLLDRDDDGHADGLRGAIYLCDPLTKDHANAGAELVAWLAHEALCLPLDVRVWSPRQPAIFVGAQVPHDIPSATRGAEVYFYPDSLLFVAATTADLLVGARHLNAWPLQSTLRGLSFNQSASDNPTSSRLTLQDGLVTLHFSNALLRSPDWAALPSDLITITTPKARYVNPNATPSAQPSAQRPPKRSFSLAHALRGGTLFTGSPYAPEALLGGFSVDAPVAEALYVAARLSTEGLQSPNILTDVSAGATVRLMLDSTDGAEVRIRDTEEGSVLEIAGGSPQAVSRAATYFAKDFPVLPDGTSLEGLEASLTSFLNGETPFGRVAMVAALQQHLKLDARRALLPHPPSVTPRLLSFPVTNTARDGKRTHWNAAFQWEGKRFVETLASLDLKALNSVAIEGFLGEAKAVRNEIKKQIEDLLAKQGVVGQVVLRSAYKPGLCWLLEEIAPQLARIDATELQVQCAIQRNGLETEDRWLRELYPAAKLIEEKYGVRVALDLSDNKETYRASAFDHNGGEVFQSYLTPPTLDVPLNGIPEMGRVSPTTGQITVWSGFEKLFQQHLPTDRDLLWQWFTDTVLSEVRRHVTPGEQGPYFGELSVVLTASEPDEPLSLDHEHLSATESLHEDIYFGTLEALHHAAKIDIKDRTLAPGRILPFCVADEANDSAARATLRMAGSYTVGLVDSSGETHAVTPYPFRIHTSSVKLALDAAPLVTLYLDVDDYEAAHRLALQLEWGLAHRSSLGVWDPFPHKSRVTVHLRVAGQPEKIVQVPESNITSSNASLPDRPLLTREVASYAQQITQRFPHARLRAVRESLHGAPLIALELTSSTPYASRPRLAAWKPTVLVSARQHANEPSSTNAMFRWLEEELNQEKLLNRINLVFHPLENPDGARLHTALCQLADRHMHHAARYTGVGADLQSNPTSRGAVIPESKLRLETWHRWQPWLHLNCHGYPAHEWVRANGGYVPRQFEAWSLPFGYFTILISDPQHEELLEQLKDAVAKALALHPHLQRFTEQQIHRALPHLRSSAFPFVLKEGFPFLLTLKQTKEQTSEEVFAPAITVITEVPDETVSDTLWRRCIEAHQIIGETVTHELHELSRQEQPLWLKKPIR